jgi:hypothetical protein
VHHHPIHVIGILIGSVVVGALCGVLGSWIGRRLFAGPRLEAWRDARRHLIWADQWRVVWATSWHRPVSRSALADAQLAYAGYFQDMARRSPLLRRRWVRVGLPAGYGLAAAGFVAAAITQSHGQQRGFDTRMAALFAVLALNFALVMPWLLRRRNERMARLLVAIKDRYAN